MDIRQAERYIEILTGNAQTKITWQIFDDKRPARPGMARIIHGTLADRCVEMGRENARGCGIFATVNETDFAGRSKQNIVSARAVWVDSDKGYLPPLALRPNLVVQTSHGQHAYWLLEPGEDLGSCEHVMRGLADRLHTDPAVAERARVLRVPGFFHNKGDPFMITIAQEYPDKPTTIREICDAFNIQEYEPPTESTPEEAERLNRLSEILAQIPRAVLIDKCKRYMAKVPGAVEGDNGDASTYKACAIGGDFGLTPDEFEPIAREWNKTCSPPWVEHELLQKIKHAYKYRKRPLGIMVAAWADDTTSLDAKSAFLKPRKDSEADICEAFIDTLKKKDPSGLVVSTGESFYCYSTKHGVWIEIPDREQIETIRKFDGAVAFKGGRPIELSVSFRRAHGSRDFALGHSGICNEEFFSKQDRGIVFKNGFAKISKDGVALLPYSPDFRALHRFPFDYDPGAPNKKWIALVRRLFDGDKDADQKHLALQEFVGACLCGIATQYDQCVVLVGEGGNGKSTFQFAITKNIFPPDAIGSIAPQRWATEHYLSGLKNKLINIVPELPSSHILESDIFKSVITGDSVQARDLYRSPFYLEPRAGHLFACNDLPTTSDCSPAFWDRFIVIRFNNSFRGKSSSVTRKSILDDLKDEAPGIMAWAVAGAIRLMRTGKYTRPESIDEAKKSWVTDADSVAGWVDDMEIQKSPDMTKNEIIYRDYADWCRATGRKPVAMHTMGRRLSRLGFESTQKYKAGRGFLLVSVPPRSATTGW